MLPRDVLVAQRITMTENTTRDLIVTAADDLFYRQGFEATSFADVAKAVGISRGNFYHHFKSKDEILDAVIALRLNRNRGMLAQWESADEHPGERIRTFVRILIRNRAKVMRHGCPVGTLCTELGKIGHPAFAAASDVFTMFRAWLRRQFEQLGRKADADELALHVLARSQGVATLAQAYRDVAFVEREVELLCNWVTGYESASPKR